MNTPSQAAIENGELTAPTLIRIEMGTRDTATRFAAMPGTKIAVDQIVKLKIGKTIETVWVHGIGGAYAGVSMGYFPVKNGRVDLGNLDGDGYHYRNRNVARHWSNRNVARVTFDADKF